VHVRLRSHSRRTRHHVRVALRQDDDVAAPQSQRLFSLQGDPAFTRGDHVVRDHLVDVGHHRAGDVTGRRCLGQPFSRAGKVVEERAAQSHRAQYVGEGVVAHGAACQHRSRIRFWQTRDQPAHARAIAGCRDESRGVSIKRQAVALQTMIARPTLRRTSMSLARDLPKRVAVAMPDLRAIKTTQQATWASGDFAVIGTTLQIVGETLAEAVDIRAGERVLDVAAGNGNATLAAARRFAHVTSTDYVPSLLEKGAARAGAEGLRVDFEVALSTFGAMFTPDHRRPADEMLRVVRHGGRIGLANWTPEGFVGQLFKI